MTELKARIRGEKRRRLEFAGFKFYQVEQEGADEDGKWLVQLPTTENIGEEARLTDGIAYLPRAYAHLTTAISAAERLIETATKRYKSSFSIHEDWQEAIRRYEADPNDL